MEGRDSGYSLSHAHGSHFSLQLALRLCEWSSHLSHGHVTIL